MDAINMKGRTISLTELVRYARLSGTIPAVKLLAEDAAIELWAERLGIQAETEELQRELTAFRKTNGLFSAAAAREWLADRDAELDDLVALLRPRVFRRKIAERIIEREAIERHFAENRMSHDLVELSILLAREYGEAQELRFRLEEGTDFHALARAYSADTDTRPAGGYAGWKGRGELEPHVSAAAFGGAAGEVLGPLETKSGYALLQIESVYNAELDDETAAVIRERLFEEAFERFKASLDIRETIWRLRDDGEEAAGE